MASNVININFHAVSSIPTTGSPGDMYCDGVDLVYIDPVGLPRKIYGNGASKYTPSKYIIEIVAWCPKCKQEYKLSELLESYYCYHNTSREWHKMTSEEITSVEDFVPVEKIECLIFQIRSENYQLY